MRRLSAPGGRVEVEGYAVLAGLAFAIVRKWSALRASAINLRIVP
jgi:hypothetical protein